MTERVDRAGQQIGDYRLIRKVGSGSFSTVYLGAHLREDTPVAVKILQAELTRSQDLKEFIKEARLMRLKHPHILPLLDFGVDENDVPFLVMPYAPGGTLRDRHPRGTRLPLATVVSYVTPLASALHYAHSLHLIHRDVKPENILLGPNNEVWLSDFGIVVVAQSTHAVGVQQGIGGTLPYMAPEQIQGKPRPASDQYALGILAYEWLCGQTPFRGTVIETITQHMMTPPTPLREHVPTLPSDVEQIVLTALAKDPKQRFATVEAFATALHHASQQVVEPAKVTPVIPAIPISPMRKTPLPAIPNESIEPLNEEDAPVIQIVSPPVQEEPEPATQPLHEPLTTRSAPYPVPPISMEISTPPVRPVPFQPQRPRTSRRTTLILASLALLILLASVVGFSANVYISAIHEQATATVNAANIAYNTYASTNGIMFGFNAAHTHVNPYERVLNPSNVGALTKLWAFHTGMPVSSSPVVVNGVLYVGSYDGYVYALDSATSSTKWAFPTQKGVYSSPAVVNGVLYIGSEDGYIYALDTATGSTKWAFPTGKKGIDSSPVVVNGVLYIGSYDGNIYALDASTGTQKWIYHTGNIIYSSPVVVNGVLYIGSYDGNVVYALDTATGTQKWAFHTTNYVYSSPAVANGVLYVGSDDGNVYALDTVTGTQKWAFHIGKNVGSSPAVANGVLYVGSDDGNVYALDIASGSKKWAFHTGDKVASSPTVVNGVLYVGSEDGYVYALDIASGSKKWAFHTEGAIISSPTVVNGVLYVGSNDYYVYAFHLAGS